MPYQIINKLRQFSFGRKYDLPTWLFLGASVIYLATRLVGLSQFPIYFFTDEAIQTQTVAYLANNKYSIDHVLLPTYFRNGLYINLGLSVYLQWLPYMLFGKSAVVTRMTSVFITLIATFSISLILRDIFKLKHWWTGVLFLSITPAWFLHSRTAFETVEFVAFYAGALCAYLFYRYRSSPRYLYVALFLAACAFYTYSPGQFIVPLTIIALMISDWDYHLGNRRTILSGMALVFILGLPYLRFIFYNPHIPLMHLNTLGSYWLVNASAPEKLTHYFLEYASGLSPWYWYTPNVRDLSRHLMKDYGHIMVATLPFAVIGAASVLRNLRQPANRVILIFMLVSPSAAALVGINITRSLSFVIPACILTAIGFERIMEWIITPRIRFEELASGPGPNWQRITVSLLILIIGGALASVTQMGFDRIVLWAITVILSVQVSGLGQSLAKRAASKQKLKIIQPSIPQQTAILIFAFILLSGINIWMLNDALRNGPTWYSNYGLDGMQYGAFQIFDNIKQYQEEHPDKTIIFTPYWANGPDVLAYFFLGTPLPIQIGSIRDHINQKLPLDDTMLFVTIPQEYQELIGNPKIKNLRTEKIVPYPDGNPGFYFVRMQYSDNADEVFAAEAAARRVLQESSLTLQGEEVKLRYSRVDSDTPEETIALLFDGDPSTMANTREANPFVVELTYPSPRTINRFSIVIGSASSVITLTGYAHKGASPVVYTFRGSGTTRDPELTFELPAPLIAQILHIEYLNVYKIEPTKIYIWEITFR